MHDLKEEIVRAGELAQMWKTQADFWKAPFMYVSEKMSEQPPEGTEGAPSGEADRPLPIGPTAPPPDPVQSASPEKKTKKKKKAKKKASSLAGLVGKDPAMAPLVAGIREADNLVSDLKQTHKEIQQAPGTYSPGTYWAPPPRGGGSGVNHFVHLYICICGTWSAELGVSACCVQ